MSLHTDYDVVIAGAGMVGAAMACCLGGSGLRVALLDAAGPPQWKGNDYALRVSAITPASVRLLKKLNAWDAIAAQRFAPIDAMHIWEAEEPDAHSKLVFDSADIGARNMGMIVENRVIQTALLQQAQAHSNVRYLEPVAVEQIMDGDDYLVIVLDNGDQVSTRLIVGADGACSKVRQLAKIETYGWSFEQTAIVLTARTQMPHDFVARQRFLATGPLAFLPLDDPHTCSIVWSADTPYAERLLSLDNDGFKAGLQESIGNVLGNIEWVSERAGYPLSLAHAREYVTHRVALIGDALHRIHPLAGQGVNLGFADAAVLAEVLLNAEDKNRDIGGVYNLRAYERWRKEANHTMIGLMDLFKRTYGSHNPAVMASRRLGLGLASKIKPLKYWFMRQASGLENELPGRFY